ncbi:MAG: hypothetical protein C4293_00465 [Nitrospiraceae bacterium]
MAWFLKSAPSTELCEDQGQGGILSVGEQYVSCPQCGERTVSGKRFCGNCGVLIGETNREKQSLTG